MKIAEIEISNLAKNTCWDFGNKILYNLCQDYPSHNKDDIILTKVLFIGRIYAAAVERRKNKNDDPIINDNFYIDNVIPAFINSNIDNNLKKLKGKQLSTNNILEILKVHNELVKILTKITELNKRSFASKYLHFHLPNLFFIYDSRAVQAMRKFTSKIPIELQYILQEKGIDKEYAKFFCKSFDLKTRIETTHKSRITTRQLDNLLMETANNIAMTKAELKANHNQLA
ncbi:MAG: hypothetical protein IPN76_30020 [Saprospiraceae bacterium]|nr:hypothetical protein [Saprospiraceae bacterium]